MSNDCGAANRNGELPEGKTILKVELLRLIHGYHTGGLTLAGRLMVEEMLRSAELPKNKP